MNKTLISWLIIAATLIASIITYPSLPDVLPIHWNINNEVDNYSDKSFALLLLPGIMVLLAIMFQLSPKFDRKKQNYSKSKSSLTIMQNMTLLVLAIIHGFIIAYGYGMQFNISMIVGPLVGILFVVIGNYMPRLQPNSLIGIRTSQTLGNETVWRQTHQASAKFYVIGGLLMIASVFLPSPLQNTVFLIIVVIVTVSSLFVSMYYAKQQK